MAKRIRQEQIEGNIVQSITGTGVNNADPKNPVIDLSALQNKVVTSIAFSGTTTKTLTITFADGTTTTSTFTDANTTYTALTAALLTAGTSATSGIISPKVLVDYINTRLSAVLSYKGNVAFASLPTTGNQTGDVYNITNAFTLDGKNYPEGSNVAWNGTAWDVLAGLIDTSVFLTEETDPKGVASLAVTGTTTKTITLTLRDGTTVTGDFTDLNTTYTAGTLAALQAGTSTTAQVWSASILAQFINSLGVTVFQEVFNVTTSNIVSGVVSLTLSQASADAQKTLVYLNGIKQPMAAQTITGSTLKLTQASLPTPVIATDEVEVFYLK